MFHIIACVDRTSVALLARSGPFRCTFYIHGREKASLLDSASVVYFLLVFFHHAIGKILIEPLALFLCFYPARPCSPHSPQLPMHTAINEISSRYTTYPQAYWSITPWDMASIVVRRLFAESLLKAVPVQYAVLWDFRFYFSSTW